jgi:tetratricopeptide (TPR) repeat protein
MAEVFISYAGPNEDSAERISNAIRGGGDSCFFAPDAIRAADEYAPIITVAINQCKIFVVLWSKEAARSDRYVLKELGHAGNPAQKPPKIILPVWMDDAPLNGSIYLTNLSSITWKRGAPALIARRVHEYLAPLKAPYPLGNLYRSISDSGASLDVHIEAARVLIRLLTVIQIAWYLHEGPPSEALNRSVEDFMSIDSLFADLDLARKLNKRMIDKRPIEKFSFRILTKLVDDALPGAREFDDDNQVLASSEYDRRNLHRLFGIPDDREENSTIPLRPSEDPLREKVLEFLRKVLTEPWVEQFHFDLRLAGADGDRPRQLSGPVELSADEAAHAEVLVRLPGVSIPLSPFVVMVPSTKQGEWEPNLFRGQEGVALYSRISIERHNFIERPGLVLPWAKINVVRSVPSVVYAGQLHRVELRVRNHAAGEVCIPELREQLPDNLESELGEPNVLVTNNLILQAGQTVVLEYLVKGKDAPDTVRQYSVVEAGFSFQSIALMSPISGDRTVRVRRLPPPLVVVSREIRNQRDEPIESEAQLDDELTITAELRSGGAPFRDATLEETVEGGLIIAGDASLRGVVFERSDLQPSRFLVYRVLLNSVGSLVVRSRLSSPDGAKLDAPETCIAIKGMPPPKLNLRWKLATATAASSFGATLAIENSGGTGAYELSLRIETTDDIDVDTEALPKRLMPNGLKEVDVKLAWIGLPPNAIIFAVSYQSVEGASFQETLSLNPSRFVEEDFSRIPIMGRQKVRDEIRAALKAENVVAFSVIGPRGSGKRRVLQSEINSLVGQEGWKIAAYEVACEDTDISDALTLVVRKIMFQDVPQDVYGSESAVGDFLRSIKMDGEGFKWDADQIRTLIHGGQATKAALRSVGLFLSKTAFAKGLDRLIIVIRTVSRFSKTDLDPLVQLRGFFKDSPKSGVRFALAAHDVFKHPALDREIPCGLLTHEESNDLINSVFIMPRASAAMRQSLIRHSEGIPANLLSFLRLLVEKRDSLLDFNNPAGVQIRDHVRVEDLPTSYLEFERHAAESSEVPKSVFACLAAAREPLSIEQIRALLRPMNEDLGADSLPKAVSHCVENHWLRDSGEGRYEITSSTSREALSLAASPAMMERAHWAFYTLMEEEKRRPDETLPHLIQSPAQFIAGKSRQLAVGLRELLNNEKFTQLRVMLTRLRAEEFRIDPDVRSELRSIELELQWEEKGELSHQALNQLKEQSKHLKDRATRKTLNTRLCLLESRWLGRNNDYAAAARIAESADLRIAGFHRQLTGDLHLEFEYYLNLWILYYRLADAKRFCHVDQLIWKRMEPKKDGELDSYATARFLASFLELHREIPTQSERDARFPPTMANVLGEMRRVADNKIEVATKPERIFNSFLNDILKSPDKLNRPNTLVIGRLYLDVGADLWSKSKTRRLLEGQKQLPTEDFEDRAISYLERAQQFFYEARFPLDLGNARALLGRTRVDRMLLAEGMGNREGAMSECQFAAKWLRIAAEGFDAMAAAKEAADAWDLYAFVCLHWASLQPSRRDEAINAYERLIKMKGVFNNEAKRDDHRRALALLYDDAGRLTEAEKLLSQIESQTPETEHLKALIRAEGLFSGSISVSENNAPEFEGDLATLRRSAPITRQVKNKGVQLATSAEAIGVIAWCLSAYYQSKQEGDVALKLLRDFRAEIAATALLSAEIRRDLAERLLKIWQMQGTSAAEIMLDYSNQLMPLLSSSALDTLDGIPDRIWSEEFKGSPDAYRAAAEIKLMLFDRYFDQDSGSESLLALAADLLQRLCDEEDWQSVEHARLVARSLAFMLRFGLASRDNRVLHEDLDPLINVLKSRKMYDAALRVTIYVVEMLLDAHGKTQNSWYFELIRELSVRLEPLQDLSSNQFEDITRLIKLYLQLPGHVPHAADLMEKQCRQLLDQKDYDTLPAYLSFLSDLLGTSLRADTTMAALLEFAQSKTNSTRILEQLSEGSSKTKLVTKVALDLCGLIIAEVKTQQLGREEATRLLYNSTKLLKDSKSADLAAAVYVKLYDLSDAIDGNCVWGTYTAWSNDSDRKAALSIEDRVALTALSNCQDESLSGEFHRVPRNYLICARERNRLLGEMLNQHPEDPELSLAHLVLEIHRLRFLVALIQDIRTSLKGMAEFDRIAWEVFIYSYVAPGAEPVPSWQKVERIEKEGERLKRDLQELAGQLMAAEPIGFRNFDQRLNEASYRVQRVLIENRRRGQEIMSTLAERMSSFDLLEVLGETERHLNGSDRLVDFGAVLGLWAEGSGAPSRKSEDVVEFLNQNPRLAIESLINGGAELLDQGEFTLAERLYGAALRLCEEDGSKDKHLPRILRGVTLSLFAQSRFAEAVAMSKREVAAREDGDPEIGVALGHLAASLEAASRAREAIAPLKRKVEIDRALLNPEDFASSLVEVAGFMLRNGYTDEAKAIEPQAQRILEETIKEREQSTGPKSADTIRAVRALARLLDQAGKQTESRLLYLREIDAISSREDSTPIDLRNAAFTCVQIGEYQMAEPLLQRVLSSGFETVGTHCHLARVMILTNRESEARLQIERAFEHIDDAEHYVVLRAIWFQTLFALLDGKNPAPLHRRLNDAFQEKGAHMGWTMEPVLRVVAPRLRPDDLLLLKALLAALESKSGLENLNALPRWRDALRRAAK